MRYLLLLLLAGCASTKTTHLPDGGVGHSINCSGGALSWSACYEKAGDICKERGYEIIAGGSDQVTSAGGSQYGFFGGASMTRSMLIRCK